MCYIVHHIISCCVGSPMSSMKVVGWFRMSILKAVADINTDERDGDETLTISSVKLLQHPTPPPCLLIPFCFNVNHRIRLWENNRCTVQVWVVSCEMDVRKKLTASKFVFILNERVVVVTLPSAKSTFEIVFRSKATSHQVEHPDCH